MEAYRLLSDLRRVSRELSEGLDAVGIAQILLQSTSARTRYSWGAVQVPTDANERLVVLAQEGRAHTAGHPTARPDADAGPWLRCLADRDHRRCERRSLDGQDPRLLAWWCPSRPRTGRSPCSGSSARRHRSPTDAIEIVERLARESALRLETALLFADVRSVATAEERRRLAREIHDGIAQELASLGYVVDDLAAAPTDGRDEGSAPRLRAEMSRVVSELRLSIFDLRSEVPAAGLGAALSDYVRAVGARRPDRPPRARRGPAPAAGSRPRPSCCGSPRRRSRMPASTPGRATCGSAAASTRRARSSRGGRRPGMGRAGSTATGWTSWRSGPNVSAPTCRSAPRRRWHRRRGRGRQWTRSRRTPVDEPTARTALHRHRVAKRLDNRHGQRNGGPGATTVLLVDDHDLIRQGLRRAFERTEDFEVVGEAGSSPRPVRDRARQAERGDLGRSAARRQRPGRGQAGAGDEPALGIVVLTMYAGDEQLFGALDAGASAFVPKDAPRRTS